MARTLEPISAEIWGRSAILIAGGFASMFTATVINAALPALSVEFAGSLDDVQWVATAFLIGLAAAIPVSGWLAKRVGVTRLWFLSLALFTALSMGCALAPSLDMLIALRLALGLAGGVLVPVSQMLLGLIAGPGRMGRVMSVLGVPIALAPALGITFGGMLLAQYGWPSLFWINVPMGLAGLVAGWLWLPRIAAETAGRFDILGFLLLALGLPLLSWGVSVLGHDSSASGHVIAGAAAGAGLLLLIVFGFHAARHSEPLLKVALLAKPVFAMASLIVFAAGFITFGAQIVLPLYYLMVRGDSAETAGLLMLPQALGIAVALPMGGWLTDRFGGGIAVVGGIFLAAAGTVALAVVGDAQSDWWLATVLVLRGFGLAMLSMPAYSAAFATVGKSDVPHAIPIINVIYRIGGALGTVLLIMMFQTGAGAVQPTAQAALTGFHLSHWIMAGLLLLTLPAALVLRRRETQR